MSYQSHSACNMLPHCNACCTTQNITHSNTLCNEFLFFNTSLFLLDEVLLNSFCIYASKFEEKCLCIWSVLDTHTLAEGFCWQKLDLWAQSQWTEVCYQCTQSRPVREASSAQVRSAHLQQSTSSGQSGLEGQMDVPRIQTRRISFLAQLQSFHWSFTPFLKLWLIHFGFHNCFNSRRCKFSCYPKSDFYFL